MNNKDILFVKHYTYLGVILDNEMSLDNLLSDIKKENK